MPASELVARALATPGSAASDSAAFGSPAEQPELGHDRQAGSLLPDSAAAGLRRDATGMAALLEVIGRAFLHV